MDALHYPRLLKRKINHWLNPPAPPPSKQEAELMFWRWVQQQYIDWYEGKIDVLYATPTPDESQKIKHNTLTDSAIMTWFERHQKPRYRHDLAMSADVFKDIKPQKLRLLDVGSGPFANGLAFENCQVYCLEPLLPRYLEIGFPIHYYQDALFMAAPSEHIPVEDKFFDVIISVNAIDHVDDFWQTSQELKRVAADDCRFAMHVHYHRPTREEPIEITDKLFLEAFGWCKNLQKISESRKKMDYEVPEGDSYVLWKNF